MQLISVVAAAAGAFVDFQALVVARSSCPAYQLFRSHSAWFFTICQRASIFFYVMLPGVWFAYGTTHPFPFSIYSHAWAVSPWCPGHTASSFNPICVEGHILGYCNLVKHLSRAKVTVQPLVLVQPIPVLARRLPY
jgi:hypothetical protein